MLQFLLPNGLADTFLVFFFAVQPQKQTFSIDEVSSILHPSPSQDATSIQVTVPTHISALFPKGGAEDKKKQDAITEKERKTTSIDDRITVTW